MDRRSISLLILAPLLAACSASGAAPATPPPPSASASSPARPSAIAGSAAAKPSAITPKAGAINIAAVGTSPSFAPLWLGIDNGLFEKYGAPVNLITTTAPPAMAALLSGDVQIAIDGGAMLSADPSGSKLAFIAAQQNAFNQFTVYAKPAIKSLAGLKGKTVSAATPGSAATVAFEKILTSAGMAPKTDVKWVYLGTPAAQWAALTNGKVDAGINAWPYSYMAQQAGFSKLADAKQIQIAGTSNSLGASRQWLKDNPKVADGFLRGLAEGAHLANHDKAKFIAAIGKHAKVTDQGELEDAWTRFSGTYPEPPYIGQEAVQEAIDDEPNAAVRQHKPQDFIDNGPLDQVVASGFTKQLSG